MSNTTNNKKIAQLIIARIDGKDINKKFKYYESLVKKGIGGFIIFGGKLKEVSRAIKKLQDIAEIPLFIASDLEQGLGQQIEGGTLFPPAMAIGEAINPVRNRFSNGVNPKSKDDIKLLRKSINTIAQEAKAAGINVILSPVLDVNTNPENPIICTRAFSDNPRKVAWFGKEFIKGFQKEGIISCAKHFPGHGDTSVDSHRELPVVKVNLERLQNVELYPFKQAIKADVKMIMVGHLKTPSIDSKCPSSLSRKIIQELLKERMKFKGLVITDAMNMKAIKPMRCKVISRVKLREEETCLKAIKAGADIVLHPSNPERVIDYLASKWEGMEQRIEEAYQRILKAKKGLGKIQDSRFKIQDIGAKSSWDLAYELTQKSIKIVRSSELGVRSQEQKISNLKTLNSKLILIIDDDNNKSGKPFVNALKKRYKKIKAFYIDNNYPSPILLPQRVGIDSIREVASGKVKNIFSERTLIIAVFSKISAFKGRSGLSRKLHTILGKAIRTSRYSVLIGFCSPYILREFKADTIIEAYSGSEQAQDAVGKLLCGA